ncbi:MAG: hypothetical protein ACK5IJ_05605 [Mangrovibacterium sp.]
MTMKVTTMSTSLRNGDVNTLAQGILTKSSLFHNENDAYLLELFALLRDKQLLLNDAINAERTKSTIQDAGKQMKTNYRKMFRFLESYTTMSSFASQSNAITVFNLFKRYSSKISTGFGLELNSYITALLADLKVEPMVSCLSSLPLISSFHTDLVNSQNAFLESYSNFHNQRAIELNAAKTRALKDEIVLLINSKLVLHINAMLQVSIDDYLDFALALNGLISERNILIKRRKSLSENSVAQSQKKEQ